MDRIVDTRDAALLLYGRATKSTTNMVRRMCEDGTIRHCENPGGGKWYINASKEWPKLVGEAPPAPEAAPPQLEIDGKRVTADTTIGELFAMLAQVAAAKPLDCST